MAPRSLLTLLASVAALNLVHAQTQCPAGTPDVQLNSNGNYYAIIPGLEYPEAAAVGQIGTANSALECSVQCDATPGCIATLWQSEADIIPAEPPSCTLFASSASLSTDPEGTGAGSAGALSCVFLAANPGEYPQPDPRTVYFESVAAAEAAASTATSTATAATTTATGAPPPPARSSSSVSVSTTAGGTWTTTATGGSGGHPPTSTATGTYTGPQSNNASAFAAGVFQVAFTLLSIGLAVFQ